MTDTRNALFTFGMTECLAYLAVANTAAPTDFSTPSPSVWTCLGWATQDGGEEKNDEERKDIYAAGRLVPIRSIITKSTKTMACTYEELNPLTWSVWDAITPDATKPNSSNISSYSVPDNPSRQPFSWLWHFEDSSTGMMVRVFMPYGEVTTRGSFKPQTADIAMLQMTTTAYPGAANSASVSRLINWGSLDTTGYYADL